MLGWITQGVPLAMAKFSSNGSPLYAVYFPFLLIFIFIFIFISMSSERRWSGGGRVGLSFPFLVDYIIMPVFPFKFPSKWSIYHCISFLGLMSSSWLWSPSNFLSGTFFFSTVGFSYPIWLWLVGWLVRWMDGWMVRWMDGHFWG